MNTQRWLLLTLVASLPVVATCATRAAARRPAEAAPRAVSPQASHAPPPRTPESDPEAQERRFGVAEARARREAAARAEAARQQGERIDVGGTGGRAGAASPPRSR